MMRPLSDLPNQPGIYLVRYKVLGEGTFGGRILAVSWADAQRQADDLGVELDGLDQTIGDIGTLSSFTSDELSAELVRRCFEED